jgi:glucose/arabinose dehydrogenase
MTAIAPRFAALLTAALLAGCGGGGAQTPPPPANTPPSFTSPASATVAENAAGTVYTATASDANSDPLTFAIAGGADAARFMITTGGALSFVTPPDFEAPGDAGGDNVYNLQLSVSDGRGGSATMSLAVTVTNQAGTAFRVRRVASGLASPLYLTGIPDNSGRVLVVEQAGRIRILNPATGAFAPTDFLDLRGTISSGGERGLLGLALAPDFAASGTYYVYLTNLAGDTELRRYRTLAGNRDQTDPASADLILTFAQPFANHNGGWIAFGPDGLLYIGSGDGGGGGDPQDNAQNTNSLLGKMLRIDVASDAFPGDAARDYAIPPGNPFAASGGAPEVYAYGLRNPFRNSFDIATGNLYIGDVGQNAVEEIDLIPPSRPGLNFGWARLEGTQTFNGSPPAGAVPPVTEYLHGTGPFQGSSVTGGYVYRGPVESLQGLYIFGDFIRARLWSVPAGGLVQGQTFAASGFTLRNTDFAPDVGSYTNIASFGEDQSRNLYIIDYDGEVFVIEPS